MEARCTGTTCPDSQTPTFWSIEPGGLDERIAGAFAHCDRGPALLVGMDTAQLTAELLSAVGQEGHDAWFGPAADGGFWALGLADPTRAGALVRGVPMSTDRTGPPSNSCSPRQDCR